eukprot:TRINITY_DN34179_c0_g1_i1.p1 TRINITY_DN34179_c0_g1~~TRINITY_DN34179_c0_g1_i1.p1  ORF type:complete len:281 (+),score=45.55 TRINITY_DN34179_c0_g1_i1:299-1141(+)
MLLYNADVDESERNERHDDLCDEQNGDDECRQSFFDLRQRTLLGMDQQSSFRVVCLGLLRKLRTNLRGAVLYNEVEDALGRYFRLIDSDMQRFASLHETLLHGVGRLENSSGGRVSVSSGADGSSVAAAITLFHEGMREIAVVLLACGEMQQRALDLKMSAQWSASQSDGGSPPLASFSRFAEFLEEALAVSDQLRRKHEELQNIRMRAMASMVDAQLSLSASASPGDAPDTSNGTSAAQAANGARARGGGITSFGAGSGGYGGDSSRGRPGGSPPSVAC